MDTPEFTQVLREHGAMLSRIAASYEARAPQRQDLEQEIAIAIWRALPSCREPGSLKSFVARIAHNRSVNHVITQTKEHRMTTLDETIADPGGEPETRTAQQQAHARLLDAVRRLPLGQRQVVTLALEGFAHAEIAAILGITVNNTDVRLGRARQALRARLNDQTDQADPAEKDETHAANR